MSVDQIFTSAYGMIQALELMPYIRAFLIVSVTIGIVRQFLNRGG